MNNILLLTTVGVACLLIITPIIVYQFIQQQQALNKIEKMLNPQPEVNLETETGNLLGYHNYQECFSFWNSPERVANLTKDNLTPDYMCKEYK
jgi:hypothetical protein